MRIKIESFLSSNQKFGPKYEKNNSWDSKPVNIMLSLESRVDSVATS